MKTFLQLIEEQDKTHKPVVMAFGRMNPPTTGHLKLIDKVKDVAHKEGADHRIIVSHSQDSKKNPLSGDQKLKHLKRYSPGTKFETSSKDSPTLMHHAAKLHAAGHDHLIVVAGSDRVKEYHDLLHKYNGVKGKHGHYNFKKIEVRSAGHRDPDAEGAEGMSGTKMREHAKNKDFSSFRQGVPHHVSDEHAKELMHDVRHGMGMNEDFFRGRNKVIFVTGCPGSGKDIIIREAIAENKIVELNSTQAYNFLTKDSYNNMRVEAITQRRPLLINCPADNFEMINVIREKLEQVGYSSLMVFVNTTDETSRERNSKLSRTMLESVRHDKWMKAQDNKIQFENTFNNFISFNNSDIIENLEEDITDVYCKVNEFIDNKRSKNIFKESLNVKQNSKLVQSSNIKTKYNPEFKAAGPTDIPADNRPGAGTDQISGNQRPRKDPNGRGHSGGAWSGAYSTESVDPKITIYPEPKESNFSKDKEKAKKKKYSDSATVNQRLRNVDGVGPQFDTRQQGTVYPMSGLGDVTYREHVTFKSFVNRIKEAIDDPGACDMGVGGVLGGSMNKEPMQSYKDTDKKIGIILKKKKK